MGRHSSLAGLRVGAAHLFPFVLAAWLPASCAATRSEEAQAAAPSPAPAQAPAPAESGPPVHKEEPGVLVRLRSVAGGTPSWLAHDGAAWTVVVSPDGAHVLTGGQDGTLRLWNAATGLEERALLRGANPIRAVTFEHKGTRLAAGGEGGTVTIFEIESWDVKQTLACPENAISDIGFLGSDLLLVFADETVGFLRPETGVCSIATDARPWPSPRVYASTVAASREWTESIFAVGEASGRIRFDRSTDYGVTYVGVRAIDAAHDGAVTALTRRPDSDLLVSGGAEGAIRLWNLNDLKMVGEIRRAAAGVTDLALSEGCQVLWVSRTDGSVVGYDFPKFRDRGLGP